MIRLGRWWWALVVVAVAPMIAAGLSALFGRPWFPASDWAIEVLRIGDVGTRHTPLLGAPSRFGWFHPGPLFFWLMAPFQAAVGPNGTLVGTAIANGVAVAGALWVMRRRAGTVVMAWTAVVIALLIQGLGVGFLFDPWNPWVGLLPFFWFVTLVWGASEGDAPLIPIAVVVGSYSMQAHVGYAPLVIGVGLLGVVVRVATWLWHRPSRTARSSRAGARRDASRGGARSGVPGWRRWGWALGGALAGLVVWTPSILQQLTGHPGNLTELVRYFRDSKEASAGWTTAVGVMGRELHPPGPWIVGEDRGWIGLVVPGPALAAMVLLAAVAVAGLAAWRVGQRRAARLALFSVVLAAIGVEATSRITGPLAGYLVRWWWVIAALLWLSLGWCLAAVAAHLLHRSRARRGLRVAEPAVAGVLAVCLVALSATTIVGNVPAVVPNQDFSTALQHLTGPVAAQLDRRHRYLIISVDTLHLGAVGVGLFTDLHRKGYKVRGQTFLAQPYGSWRVAKPTQVDFQLFVVSDENMLAGWQPPAGARRIAAYDGLDPRQRRELVGIEHSIRARLGGPWLQQIVTPSSVLADRQARARVPRAELGRLGVLQSIGDRYTVYLAPAQPS